MNFLFSEHSSPSHKKENGYQEPFNEKQLKLLEEIRAADMLHSFVPSSITEASKKHDAELLAQLKTVGLSEKDCIFFKEHYSQIKKDETVTLH